MHRITRNSSLFFVLDKDARIVYFYKTSAVAEMGDRGHSRHGPKRGSAVPLSWGELGPRLTQYGLGRGLLPYHVKYLSIQPFSHNKNEPKTGGLCPFFLGGGSWDLI